MAKTIVFINQKGGSGKTTTVLSVGACLARHGHKVLLIDADPQGNLTSSAGITTTDDTLTLYELLRGKTNINDTIQHLTTYDVVPTDIRQAGADIELAGIVGRELLIKEALAELNTDYDYILIDCPPSLGIITIMGLTASQYVLVPMQTQYLAMQGLGQLVDTFNLVKKRMNHDIELTGIILTMFDSRRKLDGTVVNNIKHTFSDKVFSTIIHTNVALAEAPAFGEDILAYDESSKGAVQYNALTNEILERIELNG